MPNAFDRAARRLFANRDLAVDVVLAARDAAPITIRAIRSEATDIDVLASGSLAGQFGDLGAVSQGTVYALPKSAAATNPEGGVIHHDGRRYTIVGRPRETPYEWLCEVSER